MKTNIRHWLTIFLLHFITLQLNADKSATIPRYITHTEDIHIESPSGTVPRLPNWVWTTYNDNYNEWRQVRWSNTTLATEYQLACDSLYPPGKEYTIKGFILGDDTSPEGYPIEASIRVSDKTYTTPSPRPIAEPLPLDQVSLEGDNRLTANRELAIRTILSWDISQQLFNYRDTYGLSTEGYTRADGWDSPTTKLKGHGSGHYMSALAFAFASTNNSTQKDSLRSRISRMVNELRQCQERTFVWNDSLGRYWEARDFAPEEELCSMKGTWDAFDSYKKEYTRYGYGYLNAIPAHHAVLIEMYRPYNNNDWVWAPYYAIHKQLAGLIDIATYVDDTHIAEKALLIAKDMGLWIWNRLHYRTFIKTDGNLNERRAHPGNRYEMWNMYIAGEDGGTGESLSRLSEMVKDKKEKERLLEAASFFDSPAFFEPLSRNIDDIRTRHANQHIPKITSALRSFRSNGDSYYYNLAYNFWNLIQGRYAYSTGGVGNGEMFRQPYTQILSMNTNITADINGAPCPNPTLNETCCAYNLAKLTKELNCFNPDNAAYMDYYERVLYNQIVGSLHPTHYLTTYHYAVGLNASKPWGNRTPQESCCGGTGSENHVKYQEAAYFVSKNTLWIGLYLPSTATWKEKGITIQQQSNWPSEHSIIRIIKGKGKFSLKLRVPYWATKGFDIRINGKSVATNYRPSSYIEIPSRKWTQNDEIEVFMPFSKHIHYGPDKMETAATAPNETSTSFPPAWVGTLMYGPLAMTTDKIRHWNEGTIHIDSKLESIHADGPTNTKGTYGNLYTLHLDTLHFVPDYYADRHSTHYLRLHVTDKLHTTPQDTTTSDKHLLQELLQIAEERKNAQESWLALDVKIPEHAPWAPAGYANLISAYSKAQAIANDQQASQEAINNAFSLLNTVINTMRPGNLAEINELNKLLVTLKQARQMASTHPTPTLTDAIDYAEMVIKYVNDGSGTRDMIKDAEKRLEESTK